MPAGLSSDDICASVDVLTAKSQSCQGPANQINVVNIALAVAGLGPIPMVIARLSDIITAGSTTAMQLQGTPPLTVKSDEESVLKSFTTFVQVHQALLNIFIAKSGLVPELIPIVGPPLASALRQLESIVDTISFELLDLIPDNAAEAMQQKNSLDATLAEAINGWSGGITL